jgi:pimeloyl-ACP methyl ester carboxylesterase
MRGACDLRGPASRRHGRERAGRRNPSVGLVATAHSYRLDGRAAGTMATWFDRPVVGAGAHLSCRDWGGPGAAVVLLHGLAGHAGEWDPLARRLSRCVRAVAVEQRGHGRSERYPADVSRAAHVADVIAVLDQLELGTAVLVGQSMGGHCAMLAAAAHPERVRALVLVEAGPGGPNPALPARIGEWLASWPAPFASRAEAVRFFGGGELGEGWAAGLDERDGGLWPRFDPEVLVRSLRENAERSFWTEWERVACPTLVVLAQRSFLGAPEVEEMVRRRPRTTAVSIPGTGHDLHLEHPDALHDVLAGFLTALPGIDSGAGCRSGPAPFVWGVGPPTPIRGGGTP